MTRAPAATARRTAGAVAGFVVGLAVYVVLAHVVGHVSWARSVVTGVVVIGLVVLVIAWRSRRTPG